MVAGQKTGRVKYLGPTKFAPGYEFYVFLPQSSLVAKEFILQITGSDFLIYHSSLRPN